MARGNASEGTAYFIWTNLSLNETATNCGSWIIKQSKATEIETALKKLVIPYKVTLADNTTNQDKQYDITAMNVPDLKYIYGNDTGGNAWSSYGTAMSHPEEIENYYVPILAQDIFGEEDDDSAQYESSLVIPASISSITRNRDGSEQTWSAIPRNHILISPNSEITQLPNFSKTNGLKSITFPNKVTALSAESLDRCDELENFEIPSNITSIGEYALSRTGLTSITIPNNVTAIGNGTISYCINLKSASWNCSVNSIPNNMFIGCKKLTKIYISKSVASIGQEAFSVELYGNENPIQTTIYYGGSSAEWNENVTKGTDAFKNRVLTVIPNSTGIPE